MKWSIAQARQHFSELLQEAAREPQEVCNRDRPVAAVVDLETFRRFCEWKESQTEATVARAFDDLRGICAEEGYAFEPPVREDRTSGWEEEPDELPR